MLVECTRTAATIVSDSVSPRHLVHDDGGGGIRTNGAIKRHRTDEGYKLVASLDYNSRCRAVIS